MKTTTVMIYICDIFGLTAVFYLNRLLANIDKNAQEFVANYGGDQPAAAAPAVKQEEMTLYNQRTAVGRIADQKKKYADELPFYSGVPSEPVSASELILRQQEILARNGENQRKREHVHQIKDEAEDICREKLRVKKEMEKLEKELSALDSRLTKAIADLETAKKTTSELQDESTAEIEKSISEIDETNQKIRANLEREKAELDAEDYRRQYDKLTESIEKLRAQRSALLDDADLPLPGLSVSDGKLTYNGFFWDNMSGSEQLRVATAIVRRLNPDCGFVLLDKLEQMDTDTLTRFGAWLESEGLQAIATRVSVGDECSVIIEDGYVKPEETASNSTAKKWTYGQF